MNFNFLTHFTANHPDLYIIEINYSTQTERF